MWHPTARLPGPASIQFRGRKLCFAPEGARNRDRGLIARSVRDRVALQTPLGDAAAVVRAVRRVGRVVYISVGGRGGYKSWMSDMAAPGRRMAAQHRLRDLGGSG